MKKCVFPSMLLWVSCCLLSFIIHGQDLPKSPAGTTIEREQWSPQPKLHVPPDKYGKESVVILQDIRRYEYIDRKEGVRVYKTLHRIVHLNDDRAIESFNRIYLGVSDTGDIVDIRARTILPNGRIIELDRKNIKDLKEENGNLYKIFAVEGLEKGCELEYYYTFMRYTAFFGREPIQGNFPVLQSTVQILAPPRLQFDIKGYNFTAEPVDTIVNGKRSFTVITEDIPGLENEKYALHDANLRRLEFKLSHNTAVSNGGERLFTWNELSQQVYRGYSTYAPAELKAAEELARSNKWDKLTTDREKIIATENWVKKNYAAREDIKGDNAENVEKIIKSRIASEKGITRLYGAIFSRLGIDYQLVLACDRSEAKIDRAFENWENADKVILYFPGTKKYLAPTQLHTRYPWIDPYWAGTDGLFCKNTTIGNFTTAMALVKYIPLEDYAESYNNVEASIRLNPGRDTLLVDMKQNYGGYSAAAYRAEYNFASPDDQRQMVKQMVKYLTNSENIVSSRVDNADFESYSDNKPFQLQATVKTSEMLETAGNKLLVKIGEIIGPQVEMYQEKPRQLPMQLAYPHVLERKIDLTVPDDYTVKNLDALNIDHVYSENGDTTLRFTSSYTREGNVVRIHVMEEYRRIFYPLEQYAQFQKVINASADFNKIVLILEKKQ